MLVLMKASLTHQSGSQAELDSFPLWGPDCQLCPLPGVWGGGGQVDVKVIGSMGLLGISSCFEMLCNMMCISLIMTTKRAHL